MLSIMRKSAKNWVIKTILFSIILVFVFWGVGNFKSNTSYKVATVNGENIYFREYSRLYHDLIQEYNGNFSNLDPLAHDTEDNFKSFVLKQIIDHKLMLQQATKVGLRVTDKELLNHIQNNQSFLNNGIFDVSQYEHVVSNLGFTPHQFEEYSREILLIKKFISIIHGMIDVSESEILEWYEWYYTLINLSYVLFYVDDYNIEGTYDKEEIHEYFKQYEQNYKTQRMYKLRYVTFHPDNYLDDVNIEESEILEYHDLHSSNFTNEKRINVSHILIKIDSNSKSEQEKKEHIENIYKMVNEGTSFSELANLYSECPSKNQDGLIGDITYESVVKPFADKAFSMVPGEVSSPVRTKFGWHIIKVNSVSDARAVSLDESREEIKDVLVRSKADMIAYNSAVSFLEKCHSEDDLLMINNTGLYNTNLMETEWFDDNDGPIEFSGNDFSVILPIISSMQVGEISDICKLDDCYLLMQIIEKNNPAIPNFEDVKIKVVADFKTYKRRFKANSDAESFLATVRGGESFEDTAKTYKVNPAFTGFFARNNPSIPENLKSVFYEKSFEMFKEGDLTLKPIETNEGFYVAYMAERKRPHPMSSLLEPEKKRIMNAITQIKQSKLFLEILEELRKTSKIEIK